MWDVCDECRTVVLKALRELRGGRRHMHDLILGEYVADTIVNEVRSHEMFRHVGPVTHTDLRQTSSFTSHSPSVADQGVMAVV